MKDSTIITLTCPECGKKETIQTDGIVIDNRCFECMMKEIIENRKKIRKR